MWSSVWKESYVIHYSKLMAFEWYEVLLWKTIIVFPSPEITPLMLGNGGMHYSVAFILSLSYCLCLDPVPWIRDFQFYRILLVNLILSVGTYRSCPGILVLGYLPVHSLDLWCLSLQSWSFLTNNAKEQQRSAPVMWKVNENFNKNMSGRFHICMLPKMQSSCSVYLRFVFWKINVPCCVVLSFHAELKYPPCFILLILNGVVSYSVLLFTAHWLYIYLSLCCNCSHRWIK